jgi:predicted outer membrane repeat protein
MKTTSRIAPALSHLRNAGSCPSIEVLESRIAPATFTVINLNDSGSGSLRAELALADAHPGPDTIIFHLPAPPLHGENIITLTSGALTSTGDVTIKGPGAGKLIINGGGNYSNFVFLDTTTNVDQPVTISGVSLVNGRGAPHGAYGGGIYSTESLNLKDVVISGNTAGTGGGVWVNGNSGQGGATELTISHSLITGNTATANGGGGVNFYSLKSFTMTDTVVTGNSAKTDGGGVYGRLNNTSKGITVTGSLVSGNTGANGGGIWFGDNNKAAASKISISGTQISGNSSIGTGAGGGGLYIGGGSVIVTGATIEGNTAVYYGGGIDATGFTALAISSSTISGNQTSKTNGPYQGGGGVFITGNASPAPLQVKVTASHFTGNSTAGSGGGIYAVQGVSLTVTGSTFTGNLAVNGNSGNGGGIGTYGHGADKVNLTVTGSTFTGNAAYWGGGIYVGDGNIAGTAGAFSISSSKVTGNSSITGGGGIYIDDVTIFHVTGGSVAGNHATTNGGGIYIGASSTGNILGVTITGNTATTAGGGVFNSSGPVTLQIAKVTGNTAPSGPDVSGTFTYV